MTLSEEASVPAGFRSSYATNMSFFFLIHLRLLLQQTLHEKWDEYRSLMVQEQRLVHGGVFLRNRSSSASEPSLISVPVFSPAGIVMSDAAVYESLESAGVYGSLGTPSPAAQRALRSTGSTSSSASALSTATEDEPLYQTCLHQGEGGGPAAGRGEAQQQQPLRPPLRLRPASELFTAARSQLSRSASTRSYVRGPASTPGDKAGAFSSLQRKPKQKSFRRRLLKFIPGLNRPMEEEESKL